MRLKNWTHLIKNMNQFKYFYCKSWFWAKKRPTEIWSEKQARQAHKERKKYTVLVNNIEKPYAVVDIAGNTNFIGVTFLDDLLRDFLSYNFKEIKPEELFLSMAVHRDFYDKKNQIKKGSSYIFNQNGSLIIRKKSFNPQSLDETNISIDTSGNYEKYPSFGQYDYLLKTERQLI